MSTKPANTLAVFESRIQYNTVPTHTLTPCHIYIGSYDKDGYGRFYINDRNVRAHRYAYSQYITSIEEGNVVMHICDNPPCVNPTHLRQGTIGDNNRDMFRKGRNARMFGEKNPHAKLTEYQVKMIRSLYATGLSQTALAKTFNISRRQVFNIVTRLQWPHLDDLPAVKGIAELGDTDSEVGTDELDTVSVEATKE